MTKLSESEQTVKWIAVKNLSVIWVNAQQPLDQKEADRIASELDPDAFGVLQVTLPNGQGMYHVIDGQKRRYAVWSLWGENEKVPCNIINAKDPKRAADLFSKINTSRRMPNVIARFHVAVTAGYTTEVGVEKLLRGLGYKVIKQQGEGIIRAVGTCIRIYKSHGPDVLRDALLMIQGTWGKDQDSTDGPLILGYSLLLAHHKTGLNRQRLVTRVTKEFTPGQLLGKAHNLRASLRGSLAKNVERMLIETYNRGLRTKDRIKTDVV